MKVLKVLAGMIIVVCALAIFYSIGFSLLWALGWGVIYIYPGFCLGQCEFMDYCLAGMATILGLMLLGLLIGAGGALMGVWDE